MGWDYHLVLVRQLLSEEWVDDGDLTLLNAQHLGECLIGHTACCVQIRGGAVPLQVAGYGLGVVGRVSDSVL